MKNLLLLVGLLFVITKANAQQNDWKSVGKFLSRDSITRKEYTLLFINQDSTFAVKGAAVKQRMIDAFFKVYRRKLRPSINIHLRRLLLSSTLTIKVLLQLPTVRLDTAQRGC
ncbi:hypothetical protein [Mucilaginibacter sp.]|uniref:hypothetical protein n=1 Tax=Mucilaginibacter sp. TaxID=1882438 RepID=UPI0035BC6845